MGFQYHHIVFKHKKAMSHLTHELVGPNKSNKTNHRGSRTITNNGKSKYHQIACLPIVNKDMIG